MAIFGGFIILYSALFFYLQLYSSSLMTCLLFLLYFIYAVCDKNSVSIINNKYVLFLSNLSFEIYLCHMMFLRLVSMLHLENIIQNTYLLAFVVFLLVAVSSTVFSYVFKKIETNVKIKWGIS